MRTETHHVNSLRHAMAVAVVCASVSSCELINPDEQIPAFLRMESYSITTTSAQGYPVHSLTDAWVYHNEELIGVYELPASIPVLAEGPTQLRIQPGMRVSGQVGQRSSHPFLNDLTPTIPLFPDSQTVYNPTVTYKDSAVFKWLESFEDTGLSLNATDQNQGVLTRVQGAEAFAGQSLKMTLSGDQLLMECATALAYTLKKAGAPIILELSYRNNNQLYIGLISTTLTGPRQTTIMALNASPDVWKHVYVNVGETVSSSTLANAVGHQVFFGFIRDEGLEGEAYAIIDNIKLIE
ncbi:MAG: hypothetical protein K9J06_14295 [Flavobacteriales bacterium]|nr:hypothetical protein [Flavobacteriales bacterium]